MTEKETSDLIEQWLQSAQYDFRREFVASKYSRVDFAIFDDSKNLNSILEVKGDLEEKLDDILTLRLYLNQCARYSETFKTPCFLGPIFVSKDSKEAVKDIRSKNEIFKYFQEFSAGVNVGVFVITALDKADPTTWASIDCFINRKVAIRRISENFWRINDKINTQIKLEQIKELAS